MSAETSTRLLQPGDEGRLEDYLAGHASTSLFLRSNLRRGGMVDQGQRFQARYTALLDGAGRVQGVVAHAWNGNLLIQAEAMDAIALTRHHLEQSDRPVLGMIGPLSAVRAVQTQFADRIIRLDSAEDLFDLDLAHLRVPAPLRDGTLSWRRAGAVDVPTLVQWRRDYCVETLGEVDGPALADRVCADIAAWVAAGDVFVVVNAAGTLLSMATHNARIPDTVQIGGVWTPVPLRCAGLARAAVAGALLAAASDGVTKAVLFTGKDNEAARRAYLALGFRLIGDYAIVLLAHE